MSLVEELGAQLRALAEEVPLPSLTVAAGHLRVAAELLLWVRQQSVSTIGTPEVTQATERLEAAAAALRVGQDEISSYLAAIGLVHQSEPVADTSWRRALREPTRQPAEPTEPAPTAPLERWWAERVDTLTNQHGPYSTDGAARDSQDLLTRMAEVNSPESLRRELVRVAPPVGLGLAAITPPVLHRLAGILLGHQPRTEDLDRLVNRVRERSRELLPALDHSINATLLARACRVPPTDQMARRAGESDPPHPADSAIAGAVLVAVLLRATGKDAHALDPHAPEPLLTPHEAARAGPGGATSGSSTEAGRRARHG